MQYLDRINFYRLSEKFTRLLNYFTRRSILDVVSDEFSVLEYSRTFIKSLTPASSSNAQKLFFISSSFERNQRFRIV